MKAYTYRHIKRRSNCFWYIMTPFSHKICKFPLRIGAFWKIKSVADCLFLYYIVYCAMFNLFKQNLL